MKRTRPSTSSRTIWISLLIAFSLGIGLLAADLILDRGGSSPISETHAEAGHTHGLGINPRDGALFVATHYGLFRVARSDGTTSRVSDSRQDTMGFAVVGADYFVGSGHPDVRTDSPPLLGLVESRDAGKTWNPVSLLGEADFHALRVLDDTIVGYEATRERIMVSNDEGRSWRVRSVGKPLIDLVAGRAGRVLVASTQSALLRSLDGGKTWRQLADAPGLLAWPRSDRLYLLAVDGRLWVSPNSGDTWRNVAPVGARPTAFAVAGNAMYAALANGSIKHSDDRGRSWRPLTQLR